jgi:hypothetical protein
VRIWTLTAVLVAVSACSNSPTAPAPPPVAACVSANTATIGIHNVSTTLTLDQFIDNQNRGLLAPGQTATYTLTAGQTHTLRTQFTNTSIVACSTTTSFVQCENRTLTCGG